MAQGKISPALWFHTEDGKIRQVIEYYSEIFKDNFEVKSIIPLGETPSGYTEIGHVDIFGNAYFLMATAQEHQPFNDAFSILIYCEDQMEIDQYWNYFTREGKEVQCGWCIDKYGLRWQIIPKNMAELMSKPNAGQTLSRQSKIIIAEY